MRTFRVGLALCGAALGSLGVSAAASVTLVSCREVLGIHDIALPPDGGEAGTGPGGCAAQADASSPLEPFCAQGSGICWRNPAPQGATLAAAWGSCSDVWAVGQGGTILHRSGTTWSSESSGTNADLLAVTGSGPRDLWTVGGGSTALHSIDGVTWTPTPVPQAPTATRTLMGVAAVSPTDAWIVGQTNDLLTPVLMHWDGSSWSDVSTPKPDDGGWPLAVLSSVWASSANDVWAAGNGGAGIYASFHWDGSQWATYDLGTPSGNPGGASIWGSAPGDVWAGTPTGAFHFSRGRWDKVPNFPTNAGVQAIWGSTSDDVWLLAYTLGGANGMMEKLYHWDGSALAAAQVSLDQLLNYGMSGWSLSRTEALIVGNLGLLLLREPSGAWTSVRTGWQDVVTAIYGTYDTDVWIGGGTLDGKPTLRHWDGSALSSFAMSWSCPNGAGSTSTPTRVAGMSGDRAPTPGLWVAAGPCAYHWNTSSWSTYAIPLSNGGRAVSAIWGAAQNDFWAVGDGPGMAHFDGSAGSAWTAQTIPVAPADAGATVVGALRAVQGSAANDVWAVGVDSSNAALALHWDGSAWTRFPVGNGTDQLTTVVSRGPTDAWAAGGQVWQWDGMAWSAAVAPSSPGAALANYQTPPQLWLSSSDASGVLWLVTAGGLFRLPPGATSWQLVAGAFGWSSSLFGAQSTSTAGYSLWLGGVGSLWTYTP